jgi:hypothetical protein
MIAAEDDDGVVVQTAAPQRVEQATDAIVDITDSSIVSPLGALDLVVGEVLVP